MLSKLPLQLTRMWRRRRCTAAFSPFVPGNESSEYSVACSTPADAPVWRVSTRIERERRETIVVSALCNKRRHSILTADARSIPPNLRNLHSLLLLFGNNRDRLETLTPCVDGLSQFAFHFFGNLVYTVQKIEPFEISARHRRLREIEPSRCKCSDGELISLRWGRGHANRLLPAASYSSQQVCLETISTIDLKR